MTDLSEQSPPTEEEVRQIVAKTGHAYPVRLLHFTSDLMVIGFVIEVLPDVVMLLRPYVVEIEGDYTDIQGYELTPYMDQLADYDPSSLTPIPFFKSSMVAPIVPAHHLLKTYTNIVNLKEQVARTGDVVLRPKHYSDRNLKH